jgi:glutamate-1-semialdehyde aminotransferase
VAVHATATDANRFALRFCRQLTGRLEVLVFAWFEFNDLRALEELPAPGLLNRGVLITPFHNMALMSPATTEAEIDRHTAAFADAVAALY